MQLEFTAEAAPREIVSLAGYTHLRVTGDVYEAARLGDLATLRECVEGRGADVDACDRYGGTPLYYAALCGHLDCVRYLIERGSVCDPGQWLGERVHYAALTDDIRRVLREYAAVNKLRGPLFAFMYRIFDNPACDVDVTFHVRAEDVHVCAHTCVLAAHSPYFRERFRAGGRWHGKARVELVDPRMNASALRALIQYMYTDRIVCVRRHTHTLAALARNTGMLALEAVILRALRQNRSHADDSAMFALDLGLAYRVGEPPCVRVREDACEGTGLDVTPEELLACQTRHALWNSLLHAGVLPGPSSEPSCKRGRGELDNGVPYDAAFLVQGRLFRVHRCFVAHRSAYFASMLRFHDSVAADADTGTVITLDEVSPSVFAAAIQFMYCDVVPRLETDELPDALCFADLTMLHDMKPALITQAIAELDASNVVAFLRIGETLRLPRLTRAAAQHCAGRLQATLNDADFRALIAESASSIVDRQEFDSIPVLDEIMYCLRADLPSELRGRISTSMLSSAVHGHAAELHALPTGLVPHAIRYADDIRQLVEFTSRLGINMRLVAGQSVSA